MFKLIEFFKKRPSDKTILFGRIIFGIIIIVLLGIYFNDFSINLPLSLKNNELYIKYSLFILGLVPIIMGAANICLTKRKYVKIIQLIFGIMLIIIGNNIIMNEGDKNEIKNTSNSGGLDYESISKKEKSSKPLNIGFILSLLSILPILAGITGKCITSKCLKYGEIITKIRV